MTPLLRHSVLALVLVACTPKAPSQASAPDARVEAFTAEVLALAEQHAWNAIVERCDPAQRAVQIDEMGMTTEQYVAEQFGLHSVGNSIDAGGDGVDANDLARIGHLTVIDVTRGGGITQVNGIVEIHGGRMLLFVLQIVVGADGRPRLTGAVG